ncbi:MAG: ATP phosphoribosyltransferase regulatory subunit [Betaproteobacteria bacterium]|jgi:ATP phosphoribosyltransferase regulatory subunit
MSRAWLLPEHIADVLPAQAFQVEALRRRLIDQASRRGFELVIPPLLEHLESLLSGTGRELGLQTFKLVDQLSGRMLGLRADTTPQAARIDAHLLNRQGVTRLCYCGPVLHAQQAGPGSSREPLQFGAEVFGHAGPESDLEIQDLALEVLAQAGAGQPIIDLADARILRGLLADVRVDPPLLQDIVESLSRKDAESLRPLVQPLPVPSREGLLALLDLFGDRGVLQRARRRLPQVPVIDTALSQLDWLAQRLEADHPDLRVSFDLADMGGYAYYSGVRFAVYSQGCADALARGGRYDEVGAVFGRNRPAVGFSLDLKTLATLTEEAPMGLAVRAPWVDDPALKSAVRRLREAGETVVFDFPGTAAEECGRSFDRELVKIGGQWLMQPA